MAARDPACGLTVEPLVDYPGLDLDPASDLARLAKRLAGREGHAKVSFGTEAGCSRSWAACPRRQSARAPSAGRTADEFIEKAELEDCAAFVRRLIADCR